MVVSVHTPFAKLTVVITIVWPMRVAFWTIAVCGLEFRKRLVVVHLTILLNTTNVRREDEHRASFVIKKHGRRPPRLHPRVCQIRKRI